MNKSTNTIKKKKAGRKGRNWEGIGTVVCVAVTACVCVCKGHEPDTVVVMNRRVQGRVGQGACGGTGQGEGMGASPSVHKAGTGKTQGWVVAGVNNISRGQRGKKVWGVVGNGKALRPGRGQGLQQHGEHQNGRQQSPSPPGIGIT